MRESITAGVVFFMSYAVLVGIAVFAPRYFADAESSVAHRLRAAGYLGYWWEPLAPWYPAHSHVLLNLVLLSASAGAAGGILAVAIYHTRSKKSNTNLHS
jgi:hypothetical protein